jgi:hypothetical protein
MPEADPAALARMQYDKDHPVKHGYVAKALDMVRRGPDVSRAARTGTPAMTTVSPTAPVSVPVQAAAVGTTDLTGGTVPEGSSALDKNPDARTNLLAKPAQTASPQPTATDAPVSNHQAVAKKKDKKKKKTPETQQQAPPADPAKAADATKTPDPTAK